MTGTSDVEFRVWAIDGDSPDTHQSSYPQLAPFLLSGREARQLNYGQGEGQMVIGGVEWGVYYTKAGDRLVVLHEPAKLNEDAAVEIVSQMCEQLRMWFGVEFRWERLPSRP